jgi:hypothetical protein
LSHHDHVHLEGYQVPCKLPKSFGFRLAVANLQDECFAFDIAKRPQLLPECLDKRRRGSWSGQSKQPYLRDLGRLLPLGG